MRRAIIGVFAACLTFQIPMPLARAQGHGHAMGAGSGEHQGRGGRGGGVRDWHQFGNYDHDRLEPGFNVYDPDRYYRDGRYYGERRMYGHERIYRGGSGRYYCRRSDGTTGLIVGGTIGGLLGDDLLDVGDSGVLGAIADRRNIRCR